MNPPLEVMMSVLARIEDNNIDDCAVITHHRDGMWRVKVTHQNRHMSIWVCVEDDTVIVSINDGARSGYKTFDANHGGGYETYIEYCSDYIVDKILEFLDEWKK